ncbi:hypothetical protein SHM_16890 [Spiroplasma ixodetis]|uniref:Uncharacterized protein n=1 Tax=Spiroplasma ixodetis TaxID=2141 RepID=A0ABM8BVZ7_9MOLU|nr:hypothetical protein SHM_16890 [Spiroplasma ixodetis]
MAINLIHPPLLIMSLVIGGIAIVLRGGAEVFSPKSKKFDHEFLTKYVIMKN